MRVTYLLPFMFPHQWLLISFEHRLFPAKFLTPPLLSCFPREILRKQRKVLTFIKCANRFVVLAVEHLLAAAPKQHSSGYSDFYTWLTRFSRLRLCLCALLFISIRSLLYFYLNGNRLILYFLSLGLAAPRRFII